MGKTVMIVAQTCRSTVTISLCFKICDYGVKVERAEGDGRGQQGKKCERMGEGKQCNGQQRKVF